MNRNIYVGDSRLGFYSFTKDSINDKNEELYSSDTVDDFYNNVIYKDLFIEKNDKKNDNKDVNSLLCSNHWIIYYNIDTRILSFYYFINNEVLKIDMKIFKEFSENKPGEYKQSLKFSKGIVEDSLNDIYFKTHSTFFRSIDELDFSNYFIEDKKDEYDIVLRNILEMLDMPKMLNFNKKNQIHINEIFYNFSNHRKELADLLYYTYRKSYNLEKRNIDKNNLSITLTIK